jgi:SAM-dependent methyltransferase
MISSNKKIILSFLIAFSRILSMEKKNTPSFEIRPCTTLPFGGLSGLSQDFLYAHGLTEKNSKFEYGVSYGWDDPRTGQTCSLQHSSLSHIQFDCGTPNVLLYGCGRGGACDIAALLSIIENIKKQKELNIVASDISKTELSFFQQKIEAMQQQFKNVKFNLNLEQAAFCAKKGEIIKTMPEEIGLSNQLYGKNENDKFNVICANNILHFTAIEQSPEVGKELIQKNLKKLKPGGVFFVSSVQQMMPETRHLEFQVHNSFNNFHKNNPNLSYPELVDKFFIKNKEITNLYVNFQNDIKMQKKIPFFNLEKLFFEKEEWFPEEDINIRRGLFSNRKTNIIFRNSPIKHMPTTISAAIARASNSMSDYNKKFIDFTNDEKLTTSGCLIFEKKAN